MPTFEVKTPVGANQIWMRQQIREAVAEATRRGKLRPNSVDSITGENSGDNLGPGHADHPLRSVGARRDRDQADPEGRRLREHQRAVLAAGGAAAPRARGSHARRRPQVHPARGLERAGQGLQPGRGRRVHRRRSHVRLYLHAKEQLFRTLDDVNPDPRLAELEASIMATVNDLEIGPMGFGGKVTLIGCKIGALNRLPASFFVSVAYDCWAFRRLGVVLDGRPARSSLALPRSVASDHPDARSGRLPRTGREIRPSAPLSEDDVRSLKVGDVVLVSGRMFTGRDAVHSHLMKHEPPVDLRGAVLYHCGPVVVKEGRRLAGHRRRTDDEHSAKSRIRARSSSATACAP